MPQKVIYPETAPPLSTLPDPMIDKHSVSNNMTQAIILRFKDDVQVDENYQILCIEWPLSLVYGTHNFKARQAPMQNIITAPAPGFVLTQIISRRGPGSLRRMLERYGWVPFQGVKGVPHITFPVDVFGFQMLRMGIGLTLEGFSNHSVVLNAS